MSPEDHAVIDHGIEDLKKHVRLLAGRQKDGELQVITKALLPVMKKLDSDNAKRFVAAFSPAGGGK